MEILTDKQKECRGFYWFKKYKQNIKVAPGRGSERILTLSRSRKDFRIYSSGAEPTKGRNQ